MGRSVATIARKQLGEEHWIQGRVMLGHVQPTTSDIYAVADPSHLGRAMAATSTILRPSRGRRREHFTALLPQKRSLQFRNRPGKNG